MALFGGILVTILAVRWGDDLPDLRSGTRGRLLLLPTEAGSPGLSWASVGLSEMAIDALRQVEGLDVVPAERMWEVVEDRGLAPESGRAREVLARLAPSLGATVVADPSLAREGGDWTLTIELRSLDGETSRSARLVGDDPLALADRMTGAVATALVLREQAPRFAHFYAADPFLDRLLAIGLADLRISGPQEARVALELAVRLSPRALVPRVALAEVERRRGEAAEASRLFASALEDAQGLGRRLLWTRVLVGLARIAIREGDLHEAEELAEQALAVQRDPGSEREILTILHRVAMAAGDEVTGRELLARRLEVEQATGDRLARAETLLELAELDRRAGDGDKARDALDAVRSVAREIGDEGLEAAALEPLAEQARNAGDLERARDLWVRARAFYEDVGDPRRVLLAWQIARATYELGELEAAEVQLGDVLDLARETGNRGVEARASVWTAKLLLDRGYPYQARNHVDRAVELDRHLGDRFDLQRVLAELAFQEDRPDLAARTLERARATAGPSWADEDDENLRRYRSFAEIGGP